jgi:hypothetical protein
MSLLSWLVDIHVSPKLQLYTNSLSICELCSLYCSLLDTKDNCCSHHLLNTDILVMRNQLIHNCLTLHHSCACPKRAPGFSKTYVMVYLCVQWFKVIVLLVLMELLTITLFKNFLFIIQLDVSDSAVKKIKREIQQKSNV